jgi:hypothetical protein
MWQHATVPTCALLPGSSQAEPEYMGHIDCTTETPCLLVENAAVNPLLTSVKYMQGCA